MCRNDMMAINNAAAKTSELSWRLLANSECLLERCHFNNFDDRDHRISVDAKVPTGIELRNPWHSVLVDVILQVPKVPDADHRIDLSPLKRSKITGRFNGRKRLVVVDYHV